MKSLPGGPVSLAIVALFVFGLSASTGAMWSREMSAAGVHILGGGTRVGLLITQDNTRILVVNGSDVAAFGNALSEARKPGFNRIDVMIVTGNDSAMAVAARNLATIDARQVIALGPLVMEDSLPWPPNTIPGSGQQMTIGDNLMVQFESVSEEDVDDSGWRIKVVTSAGTIAMLSDAAHIADFSWSEPISALVLQRGDIAKLSPAVQPRALIAAGSLIDFDEADNWLNDNPGKQAVLRIFSGQSSWISFSPDGLSFPEETMVG